jgi:hypothetical protein
MAIRSIGFSKTISIFKSLFLLAFQSNQSSILFLFIKRRKYRLQKDQFEIGDLSKSDQIKVINRESRIKKIPTSNERSNQNSREDAPVSLSKLSRSRAYLKIAEIMVIATKAVITATAITIGISLIIYLLPPLKFSTF